MTTRVDEDGFGGDACNLGQGRNSVRGNTGMESNSAGDTGRCAPLQHRFSLRSPNRGFFFEIHGIHPSIHYLERLLDLHFAVFEDSLLLS